MFTEKKKVIEHSDKKENSTMAKTKHSSSMKKIGKSLQMTDKKSFRSSSIKALTKIDPIQLDKSGKGSL